MLVPEGLKKTVHTVFLLGLLVLAILSVVGLVYLSQMAYSDQKQVNGLYCGNTNATERNIARVAIVVLWLQFAWIVLGSFIRPIWMGGKVA